MNYHNRLASSAGESSDLQNLGLQFDPPVQWEPVIEPHYKVSLAAWLLGQDEAWVVEKIEHGLLDEIDVDGETCVTLRSLNGYVAICCAIGEVMENPQQN